jgi:hypothetical protein
MKSIFIAGLDWPNEFNQSTTNRFEGYCRPLRHLLIGQSKNAVGNLPLQLHHISI